MDVNGCHGFRIHRMHPIYPNMASLSRAPGCSNHPLHRWPFSSAEILSWKIRPPNLFQTVVKSQPETVVISNVSLLWVFQLLNVTKLISWYIMIYHACIYLISMTGKIYLTGISVESPGIRFQSGPAPDFSASFGAQISRPFQPGSNAGCGVLSPKKIWCKNCNW